MTTLYEKRGRRYVPLSDYEMYDGRDTMRVGTFRLTYCYQDGGKRYSYDVTPDTAGFVAAAGIARQAMEAAMTAALLAQPAETLTPYTQRQLALLDEFRIRAAEIGMLWPTWWQHSSVRDISEAAINAVREYRP